MALPSCQSKEKCGLLSVLVKYNYVVCDELGNLRSKWRKKKGGGGGERERETETERQTDRQTD